VTALGVVDEAGLTQTGHVRRNNEDSYLIRGDLFMIADGMGGAAAGEVASAMCAQAFAEIDLIRSRGDGALRDAIVVANTRIHERAASDPAASGMGTTVTAALVESDGRVALANVGDSRAYLLREGALRRLTEDHSVVAELVATGQISDWEASSHPQRNVVTRVLGAEATVQVDTFWLDAQDGDVVLLCSDGLTDMVAEEEFAKLLAADKSCEQIARDLVRAALAQGGEDNVTTVLFRIGPSQTQEAAQPRTVLTQDPDL
jgi:serine/threonine protein phosphatase PrpC